jgi:DNA-binding beta-propeller fold protein YncE
MRRLPLAMLVIVAALSINSRAQDKVPLELVATIPLPGLHDGDFDHFAIDLQGHRLFLTAEENSQVDVFDTDTNKLIHTITGLKAPHSIVYRGDLQRIFVVDGDAAEIKVYDGPTYQLIGHVKLSEDADSMVYDPFTQYMYVVNGGRAAHTPYSFISVVDTYNSEKIADIKIDANRVEAMAIERTGSRLFANITASNAVGVLDREKRTLLATWSISSEAEQNVPLAYDEINQRLFVVTRKPAKLIVLDSNSGKVVASLPCVGLADDAVYDPGHQRIYVAGDQFVDVFQQQDADHYTLLGRAPGGFRAKTGILVPDLERYYLAVPHHENKDAEVRVFKVLP